MYSMRCGCHHVCIIGVGLAEGRSGAVRWSQLLKMFCGWVFTLFIGGIISAVLFAWGTYAPNKAYGVQILQYQKAIENSVNAQLSPLNAAAAANGANVPSGFSSLNDGWKSLTTASAAHPWPSTTTPADSVVGYLNSSTTLLVDNSKVAF
eukprot:GHUV01029050.1.p1 GENE.GHUV01029050.1~~GHUV01029050.1.p1  ORF type:complete len:150 (-),score=20.76 GHUV01029050.1:779-1228(-)